jgi:hypothetical protein
MGNEYTSPATLSQVLCSSPKSTIAVGSPGTSPEAKHKIDLGFEAHKGIPHCKTDSPLEHKVQLMTSLEDRAKKRR